MEKAGRAYDVRYDRYTDESGQDMGMIVVFQDITEQQKLENMQRDFVANVSHELKTPLTTIKSYTETLMHTEINDCSTIEHFLRIIDEETDRMSRLVRNLLQLSKLDYKQEKWFKKDTNLVNVVKTALSKVEMTAANKDQQLISLFDPKQRIMTVIDRDRIDQVLLNVLTNAIKYTPEGGKIEVDVFSEDPMAKVVIADSGIGIAERRYPGYLNGFTGWIRPDPGKWEAQASVCPSPSKSLRNTGEPLRSKASWAKAPVSPSAFPCPLPAVSGISNNLTAHSQRNKVNQPFLRFVNSLVDC